MSNSNHTLVHMEDVPLRTITGSGDSSTQESSSRGWTAASCCSDKYHRKLAISSIICGISCIGINALINSVKAETTEDQAEKSKFSLRARKLGIISIVAWVSFLAMCPILLALFSYLATLKN
ncbi:transmembrane protein 265-like [Echeneis naucrates]|uniref:transmembrane protein 265-like n=1 Tax=Echeneis naucrates TaxID=173247 RepID=UPI001113997D|nr:transmembrane protein 265 [Echeneis naucrates]